MTFSIQETDWDISEEEFKINDLTLSDILAEPDRCMNNRLMGPEEIKLEDQQYQPTSMLASSSSTNMPVLCEAYNPYLLPSPQVVRSLASPSNTYIHSSANCSSYSSSPMGSPQQPLTGDDFMRYISRQQHPCYTTHDAPQANDYGGYYYGNDYMEKRHDDELTSGEYEKRRLRRERNKQAALRCRNRRRERIEALEQETSEIEEQNENVQVDITKLQSQIVELKDILKGHNCQKDINLSESSSSSQSKSDQVKVKPEPK